MPLHSFLDGEKVLVSILDDLGMPGADTDAWCYDKPTAGEWFTANNPDTGEYVETFIEHVDGDRVGYGKVLYEDRS